jgi:hypothetical protein
MPVLIPIVVAAAAWGSAAFAVSAAGAFIFGGMVAAIGSTLTGMVVGAVVGAAVGAVGAAITGGDIGKGALWGAVGGAVVGGLTGFMAGGSSLATGAADGAGGATAYGEAGYGANPSLVSQVTGPTTSTVVNGTEAGSGSLMNGMGAAAVTTAGSALSGMAGGEAAAESQTEALAAAEKERKEQFAQRMQEIQANHENSMAQIGEQTAAQMAQADKNNESQMALLNTRIGADKDTVSTATAREKEKIAGFNDSVRGTDATLFDRPTLSFEPGADMTKDIAFNSGFEEAAAKSPNAAPGTATPSATAGQSVASNVEPVATISLEQFQAIKDQQATKVA